LILARRADIVSCQLWTSSFPWRLMILIASAPEPLMNQDCTW
jgi:hypothetical protein